MRGIITCFQTVHNEPKIVLGVDCLKKKTKKKTHCLQCILSDITGGSSSDHMQPLLEPQNVLSYFFHICSRTPHVHMPLMGSNWWSYPLMFFRLFCHVLNV